MKANLIILFFVISFSLCAQEKGTWVKGKASVFGTDFAKMQVDAVKRARADALNQAGIVVSASSFRVQTETNKTMNDYYSQFTEASSRGIIMQERNSRISDPVRITKTSAKDDMMFHIEAEIEALVVIPEGKPDPGFSVTIQTKKTIYRETDAVQLEITSSRDGFVTIIHVKNDTIEIAFPNGFSKNNTLTAKKKYSFPKEYELSLTVDGDERSSNEEFIVVVTKDNVPLIETGEMKIVNDEIVLQKLTLTDLSQWLFNIPLDQRTISHKVLTVVK